MKTSVLASVVLISCVVGGAVCANAAHTAIDVSFEQRDVSFEANRSFHDVTIDGCVTLSEVGQPALPVKILHFVIPSDVRVEDVVFSCDGTVELPGTHRITPTQPGSPTGVTREWVEADPAVYSSDELFPAARVEYLGDGYLGGHRIASVAVHPLQYAPKDGRLFMATGVSVELSLAAGTDRSWPRERSSMSSDESYRRIVRSLVENPEDVPEASSRASQNAVNPELEGFNPRYTPSLEGSAVEYIIITSDEFEPMFQEFADWKTRLGVPTVVRTLSWIEQSYPGGVDVPERMRIFIQDAYSSWGTTYVLLGGDTGIVPERRVFSTYQGGEMIPADIYFSSLEGDWNGDGDDLFGEGSRGSSSPGDSVDLYPDVFVGRAPVGNIVELDTFISKCHAYIEQPEVLFTDRNLFLAEVLFPYDWESGPFSMDGATHVMEPALDRFPGDLHLSKLYANHDSFPDSEPLGVDSAIDSLNAGYNIAFHVGHGSKDIIRVSNGNYIGMSDVSALSNGLTRSSFLWLLDCSTAAMDFDCIAERALNNPEGAAVGAFGSTRLEFPGTVKEYLWEWLDVLYANDINSVGETCALAKAAFASPAISGLDNTHRWTQLAMLLLGDPELPLWTSRARTLSVTHASSVTIGEGPLSVTVTDGAPVEGAMVCVMKDGEVYERALTGVDGVAELIVRPDTEGTINVAVTGLNYIPNESSVDVTAAPGAHMFVGSVGLDDGGSFGNGNGEVEAGESAELSVEFINGGVVGAESLTAVLRTSDLNVTIGDSTEIVGSVAPGAAVSIGGAFGFATSIDCPPEHDVTFTIELTDGARAVWTDDVVVRIHRPDLLGLFLEIDDSAGDGDGTPEPGETVGLTLEIRNDGTGCADGVAGVLTSATGGISIVDGSDVWGDVHAGKTSAGSTGFEVTLGPDISGELLALELTDRRGHAWVSYLDLVAPTSPDSVGAKVKGTTIELAWTRVTDVDLYGYTVHRSENVEGPFERVNDGVLTSACLYADAGLAENTLYHYCVAAVDSSGNSSGATQVISISTNPPSQSGWPLATAGGMYASPAVADLDGDGVLEIVVASEHLYAWSASGVELVDGDGDPRTTGIFETDGLGGYRCSPAIGEVDGDVGVEIVAAAWADVSDADAGLYEVYVWNAEDGSVLDGWPRLTKRFCWASPVLADLDRDGLSEVVIASADGYLYCWNYDGSEYIDGDMNPATNGVFADLGASWVYGSTAAADLDGDGVLELIQPAANDSVYAFHADGSRVDGWPVCVEGRSMCSPAVGDVDGDGELEVVVGSNSSDFWLLEADGSVMDGWPRHIPTGGDFPPSPVLADIIGDEHLEVIIAGQTGWLIAVDYLGVTLPGWPVSLESTTSSSPVVADLDGDPEMEIVIGSDSGKIYAFDNDAEVLPGWPIQSDAEVVGTATVCDLDGDGDNEVVFGGMDTNVYVWDCAGRYEDGDGVQWGAFLHDEWRTQLYGFEIATGVDDWSEGALGLPAFALEQNSPNPFNPVTAIGFTVPAGEGVDANVSLAVYAADGSLVRTLVDRPLEGGRHHSVIWDGRDTTGSRVASGVYFYRLAHDGGTESRSMVLLK